MENDTKLLVAMSLATAAMWISIIAVLVDIIWG